MHNLFIGGGLTIGLKLIEEIVNTDENTKFHIVIPKTSEYESFKSNSRITFHRLPDKFSKILNRLFLGNYLSNLAVQEEATKIFSLSNYAIKTKKPQLLMLHWPYAVYPNSVVWKKMGLINKVKRKIRLQLFKSKLQYATALTVQTETMKNRFRKYFNSNICIHVNPSFIGFDTNTTENSEIDKKLTTENYKLLFISEFYSHKNFDILIPLLSKIEDSNEKISIVLTINPIDLPNSIRKRILTSKHIINLGKVNRSVIQQVYKQTDTLFLPTLIESFGIPYVEAMQLNKPIITSDLDFAHDVCKENALYFDPNSPEDIYQSIVKCKNLQKTIFPNQNLINWTKIWNNYYQVLKTLE